MAARPAAGSGGAAAAAPGALQTATRAEFAVLVKGTEETAHWLADLLRAQLLLVEVVPVRRNTRWLLLVRLKPEDAPAMAEKVGVFKIHRSGSERPFVLDHWRDFGRGDETRPEELFSLTERQEIVQNVIDGIRAEQLTEVVGLGHRCVLVHPGQSVFAVCCRAGIVEALFAPHDYELLSAIRRQWLSNLTIPVHMIKVYFGIRIAFYYAFLSFYTWSLMVPMTVGVLVFEHRDSLQWRIAGVLFNLLWNTVILEVWRKRADYLSCFWGLHEQATPSRNRLLFAYGENMLAQRAFRIIISQVVVLFCVMLCVLQQYQYLTLEAYVSGTFPTSALGDAAARVVPGVVNTLVGMAFSDVYRALSQRMTEWENHQTQAEYLQHLTYKLILFDFFGRFGSLFYTAFYLQDIQLLRKQVYIQLLMSFTKDNLVEIVMPRAMRRFASLVRHMIRRESNYLPGVHSILSEADMAKYTSTYVDYYKMFSQFAFVFLFGPVVPLAPLIAFFGNLLEMLVVGYKLTVVFQRPLKIGHEGIGIWEPAFRAIGFLAVPTNIALICVENPDSLSALSRLFTDTEFVLFLVGIEHAILLLKLTLQYALRSEVHCPHYSPAVTT
ncbi:anoctamin-10 [Rhipicephalus sanguineus]|uniref:Anoctamin n=1 Tax=Rhipicephalus sanguineus TaxID=34632 RepID=A0A9D4SNG1_RHISA|nr:anoctamin-10 [Rhipicephalus sanguineus]KAH7934954.1 hypothetical protein HPB52_002446 [Rhipicephalus sanguineus]